MALNNKLKNALINIPFIISAITFALFLTKNSGIFMALCCCIIGITTCLPNMFSYCIRKISAGTFFVSVLVLWFLWYGFAFPNMLMLRPAFDFLFANLGEYTYFAVKIVSFYFVLCFTIFLKEITENKRINNKVFDWLSSYIDVFMKILISVFVGIAVYNCFNGYIWHDEAFTLKLLNNTWLEMLENTAQDVHPPLYYMIAKLFNDFVHIFTEDYYCTVVALKLCSVVPLVLTAFMCRSKLKKHKNAIYPAILCIFAMPNLIAYSVEIRMYSWAVFFVTGVFFYARDIMNGEYGIKAWSLLVLFSLLSAYTHNFALVAAFVVWVFIFVWLLANSKKQLIGFFAGGSVVAVGYFPWLMVLLKQLGSVNESYWIPELTFLTVVDYFRFIFGIAIFILVLALFSCKSLSLKSVIHDYLGVMLALSIVLFALIAAFVIRPIFVSRYIVPCLCAVWISLMVMLCKEKDTLRVVTVLMVFVCGINSAVDLCTKEYVNNADAKANMELISQIEKEDSIILSSGAGHMSKTLSAYTLEPMYYWAKYESKLFGRISKNYIYLRSVKQLNELLDSNKDVYYFEYVNETPHGKIPFINTDEMEYIGTYKFQFYTNVYKSIG